MEMPNKWQIVHFYIKKAIEKVNQKVDMKSIREQYSMENEERSCRMSIVGLGELYLTTDSIRIREIDPVSKVTSVITIDEDTFIRIKKGEMSFDDAYWMGQMNIAGDFWLRDLVIFSEVFKQFGTMVKE